MDAAGGCFGGVCSALEGGCHFLGGDDHGVVTYWLNKESIGYAGIWSRSCLFLG